MKLLISILLKCIREKLLNTFLYICILKLRQIKDNIEVPQILFSSFLFVVYFRFCVCCIRMMITTTFVVFYLSWQHKDNMHNFVEPSITTQRLFPQQMSMKKHYWIIGSCHKYEALFCFSHHHVTLLRSLVSLLCNKLVLYKDREGKLR